MPEFEIVYDPETSPAAGRYVARAFFSPRELPMAALRMLGTREFLLWVGLPCAVLAAGRLLLDDRGWFMLAGAAAAWLAAGAAWMLSLGRTRGIGCRLVEDGVPRRLVGGLRTKVSRHRMWLAGVFVDPAWRGCGIFPALLLAAFRMAAGAAKERAMTVAVFAAAHAASRHVVEKYLDGRLRLAAEGAPDSAFARALARLDAEVRALDARGIRFRFSLRGPV